MRIGLAPLTGERSHVSAVDEVSTRLHLNENLNVAVTPERRNLGTVLHNIHGTCSNNSTNRLEARILNGVAVLFNGAKVDELCCRVVDIEHHRTRGKQVQT